MSATQRFHQVANDALVQISAHLWPGAKLCLVVYAEGKPSLDIVLNDNGISLDEVVSTLRRAGLSIDGNTAYKLDLCDSIAGAMAFGYQNTNHPPEGHWAKTLLGYGRGRGRDARSVDRCAEAEARKPPRLSSHHRLRRRLRSSLRERRPGRDEGCRRSAEQDLRLSPSAAIGRPGAVWL